MGWPPAIGPRPCRVSLAVSLSHSEKGIGSRYRGCWLNARPPRSGSFVGGGDIVFWVDKGDIRVVLPIFSVSSHLKSFRLFMVVPHNGGGQSAQHHPSLAPPSSEGKKRTAKFELRLFSAWRLQASPMQAFPHSVIANGFKQTYLDRSRCLRNGPSE